MFIRSKPRNEPKAMKSTTKNNVPIEVSMRFKCVRPDITDKKTNQSPLLPYFDTYDMKKS